MDLVALDSTGAITLIEVKRDANDTKARKDHAEIQAVRYAASLARLRSVEELVLHLYAPFIDRYEQQERQQQAGGRSSSEWARKKLTDFMASNKIEPRRLNHAQKIVLIGASFDDDTKSAAAWMAENGLPMRVIEVRPRRLGEHYFLEIEQVIPPASNQDFYVDVTAPRTARSAEAGAKDQRQKRASRPRVPALFDAGYLKAGQRVWFKSQPDKKATLTENRKVEFEGEEMSLLAFGKKLSGWGAVNVYDWMVHEPTGKLIGELREQLEADLEAQERAAVEDGE